MAGERTLPGLGLTAFWNLGDNSWKPGMDDNIRVLSAIAMPVALDFVSATPGSPADGDIYIFDETHATQPNKIAVYDDGGWIYITPSEGWLVYDVANVINRQFDGTIWAELETGGSGIPPGGSTGQVLTKQSGADGDADWQAQSASTWQLIFRPTNNEPPTSNFATLNLRNNHPVLQFDTTTQEVAIFSGVLPNAYTGNGLIVEAIWSAASATSGTVGWDIAIERIGVSQDIDTDSFATAQTITAATTNATSGIPTKTSVNIANGTDMDSLAAGEAFRVRIRRDVANDTATGDAELLMLLIREQ